MSDNERKVLMVGELSGVEIALRLHRLGGSKVITVYTNEGTPEQVDAFLRHKLESKQRVVDDLLKGRDRGDEENPALQAPAGQLAAERASVGSDGSGADGGRAGQGAAGRGQGEEPRKESIWPPHRLDDPDGHDPASEASPSVGAPSGRSPVDWDSSRYRKG